jgi:predicted NAD/FAD-binding protein
LKAAWLYIHKLTPTTSSFRWWLAWAAWNYAGAGALGERQGAAGAGSPGGAEASVSVTYLINRLQPLPVATPVMVTLNPHRAVDPAHVIRRIEYAHPMLDAPALAAQQRLPALQGASRTWYCGAWTGYGFHEDGLKSGLNVGRAVLQQTQGTAAA